MEFVTAGVMVSKQKKECAQRHECAQTARHCGEVIKVSFSREFHGSDGCLKTSERIESSR